MKRYQFLTSAFKSSGPFPKNLQISLNHYKIYKVIVNYFGFKIKRLFKFFSLIIKAIQKDPGNTITFTQNKPGVYFDENIFKHTYKYRKA